MPTTQFCFQQEELHAMKMDLEQKEFIDFCHMVSLNNKNGESND